MSAPPTAGAGPSTGAVRGALVGRTFLGPAFDYLLIGGGLSIVVTAVVLAVPGAATLPTIRIGDEAVSALPWVLLLCNSAHFASSTVRLYTIPGASRTWPRLTFTFPFVALSLLTLSIVEAETLGYHLMALAFTWSPYHYAAQVYGLSVMYSYRSGCRIDDTDKRLLRWISSLPFLFAILQTEGAGLGWLLPAAVFDLPGALAVVDALRTLLGVAVFAGPAIFYARVVRTKGSPPPLITLVLLVSNGLWWVVLTYRGAFFWATVFHGVQYLAIVIVFHVKDQMALPDNRHRPLYHVLKFYGASLVLAYLLFSCLPQAYVWAGFGMVESTKLVFSAINIHHFIVDGFIWRLGAGGRNRQVVEAGAAA
ncbi:MAG: hypothetical protein QNK04_33755 [Myxococcota bacterium]|nr:hypothetical protein [Myxococcota bacterium]